METKNTNYEQACIRETVKLTNEKQLLNMLDGEYLHVELYMDQFSEPVTIDYVVKKLAMNGKLDIYGTDLIEFCRQVYKGEMAENKGRDTLKNVASLYSMDTIVSLLREKLEITRTFLYNGTYCVSGIRHE